ncbi:hypothetical protein A9Q78_07510 [Methylophaga sp. 41_12_T18]|nr:hypothetical protein A9Q78_07510 [Methylophaga sp. 41_12_T18]
MAMLMNFEDEALIVFYISGVLAKDEFERSLVEAEPYLQRGEAKVLSLISDFLGVDSNADWSDSSFQQRNDELIEKMAIVCEPQWKEATAIFTLKGLRPFPIIHFTAENEAAARTWLLTDTP